MSRILSLLLCLGVFFMTAKVSAQNRFYHVYIDTDDSTSTGCVIDLPDFSTAINGADGRVTITTDSSQPPVITATNYHLCDGGLFDTGTAISPAALGLNTGTNNSDVFEAQIPRSALGITSSGSVIFYYATDSNTASDIVLTSNNGGRIFLGFAFPVPAIGLLALGLLIFGFVLLAKRNINHKLTVALVFIGISSVAWAMGIIVDGQTSDWNNISPANSDPVNDTSAPGSFADLTQVYLVEQNDTISFRMDVVDVENQAPVAENTNDTTLEDNTVTITVTGSDAENEALTFSANTQPNDGSLSNFTVVNATTSTVDYTPNADFNGNDTFTIVANDGQVNSAPATVDVTITAVNDEPTFTSGGNVNQLKTAGPYSEIWASDISAGADNESQALTFNILSNDNAAIFTTQPSIDDTGLLTFDGVLNATGTANLTINLTDDGGTATGGDDTSVVVGFSITLQGVNDEPSFTAGADQVVNEDAGAQSIMNWATAISAGPADESGQALTFNITANDNVGLFSAGPAVTADGTLSYTPAADANGVANITLELMDDGGTADGGDDTSAPQNLSITVNSVNDAPLFTAGPNETVLEGAGTQTVNNWATGISPGPADEAAQTTSFTVTNNNNALFSVQPTIDPAGNLSYTPSADLGTATVSVSIVDNGGTANGGVDTSAIQTFDINVTAVNDEPSFTAGPNQTTNEDAGAQSIAGWASNILAGPPDEVGQVLTFNITANDNAALFSAGPSVAADGTLTYTPAADANGVANISLELMDDGGTANGGDDTSPPQSFSITVNAINDAPTFTAGANESVLEGATAQTVNGWATGISPGPADESTQTVSFNVTNNNNALFSVQPALDSTGNLSYTPSPTALGSATVSVSLMDDGGTANGGVDTSAIQTFDISITAVNDEPSFTAGPAQNTLEDAGAQSVVGWATAISAGPADESGQLLSFNITANDNAALFSAGPTVVANGTLSYTPAANASGVANITLELMDDGGTANGGDDTSPTQSFSITVNAVNDEPSFTPGADQSILENSGAQTVNGWATAISAGPADEAGQVTVFNVSNNNNALFSSQPAIDNAGNLTYTSATNVSGSATVSVELMDNGGTANGGDDTSATVMFTITINFINDAPSFTAGADQTVAEDAGAQSVIGWATNILAGPPDEAGQALTFNITGNTNAGLFSVGPAVATNGDLSFTPAANASGSATIMLTLMDDGGTANGGADTSAAQSFDITVNEVNDPPSVNPPGPFSVTSNIRISVPDGASDLLAVATDPEGNTLTIQGTGTIATNQSGTILVNNASGVFTYDPPAGFTGADTFDYQVCDNGVPVACSPMVTVTLNVAGNTIWFIDNMAAAGNGTLQTPFNSLAAFNASSDPAAGDFVYLATGSGTYAEAGISLANNQTLLGQGATGVFDTITGITPAAFSINRPTLGGTRPTITSTAVGINMANNNTIRGLNIGNTAGFGLRAVVGGNITVNEVSVNGNGGAIQVVTSAALGTNVVFDEMDSNTNSIPAIDMNGVSGTLTVTNPGAGITNGSALPAVRINGGSMTMTYPGGITNTAGRSVDVNNTNAGATLSFNGLVNDDAQGISLTNNTGATINFASLDLDTGTDPAFTATGGGTINVTGATNTIDTTTGLIVNVVNTNIGAPGMTFRSLTNIGAVNGIVLTNTGSAGGLTVTGDGSNTRNGSGGSITNTTSHAVLLNNTSNITLRSVNIVGPGNSNAEHGIFATNLGGTNLFRGINFTGQNNTNGDYIRVNNNTQNLTLLEINNSLFTGVNNLGNDGILLIISGAVVARLDVLNNNHFDGLLSDGVQVIADNQSAVTVNINNNRFSNDSSIQSGGIGGNSASRISLGTSDSLLVNGGTLVANVINNVIDDTGVQSGALPVGIVGVIDLVNNQAGGALVNITGNDIDDIEEDTASRFIGDDNTTMLDVTVVNNDIDNANAGGLFFNTRDNSLATELVMRNNRIGVVSAVGLEGGIAEDTVRLFIDDFAAGANIFLEDNMIFGLSTSQTIDADFESGPSNLTLHDNTISNVFNGGEAIDIEADNGGALCLDMNSDNIAANANTFTDGPATGDSELHRESDAGTYGIEDLGATTTPAAVAAFMNARNNFNAAGGGAGTLTINNETDFSTAGDCTLPTP